MRASSRTAVHVAALVVLLFATAANGFSQTGIPAAPTAWVTDTAGLLSPRTVNSLNDRLRSYERQTGHQIIVYIAPTTGGIPIEDWAVDAFQQWKVGRKGLDDGLVLFIFPRDHALRIEVGYGLEPKIPDALAGRILRDTIEPGLRAGQPDQAVTAGIDRILTAAGGEAPSSNTATSGDDENAPAPLSPLDLVAIGLVFLVVLGIAVRSPWLAIYLLFSIFGGRGGGFSGDGGFSGGGGRSGGGGASGRW